MKYAVMYESAPDVAERVPEFYAAHLAWYEEFHRRGDLLMIGPFSDRTGALLVFASRSAAEEFVAGDPFVTNGLVATWRIREWLEGLVPEVPAREPAAGG